MEDFLGVTGIVETATVKAGYCVKKGTAEKGVVIAGAGEKCVGVTKGNVQAEESYAVGEQVGVNVSGFGIGIAGSTILSLQDLKADSAGKLVPITDGGTSISAVQRVAVSLENALAGQSFRLMVKNDVV